MDRRKRVTATDSTLQIPTKKSRFDNTVYPAPTFRATSPESRATLLKMV